MLELKPYFRAPVLNVMNFLNEVVLRYPDAISLAPGRPHESLFGVEDSPAALERFVQHRARSRGVSPGTVHAELGQYQRTNGIIADLIARQLAGDERILVDPDSIMVTHGAQEAMLVLMLGLFEPATDVLLCSDPTYIGMTGPAGIVGVEVVGVPSGPDGVEPRAVEEAAREVRRRGRVPRAFYDVPDFNNPLGTTLPRAVRLELLEVARSAGLLLVEDNPYGMFAYDGERQPTLKSLDTAQVVVYIGSFAKTVFPGLRLGFMVADQRCEPDGQLLAVELSRVKSLTTVTTSTLPQAVLGGILLEGGCSLEPRTRPKIEFYRASRDHMLAALEREFGARNLLGAVTWNRPSGGFFLTVTLPFAFDERCLERCAGDYGVIVCPMSFFMVGPGRERQVRLTFSYADKPEIDRGIERLARFVSDSLPPR